MKRKTLSMLLALVMLFSLTACGGSKDGGDSSKPVQTAPVVEDFSWWEGDWYGWWTIFDGDGFYYDQINQSWDCCVRIEPTDGGHMISIWDESYNAYPNNRLAGVLVDIDTAANKATSLENQDNFFYFGSVGGGDWVIDPKYAGTDDMLIIEGSFVDDEGEYCEYGVVMSKWGKEWVENQSTYAPYHYYDYFLPLMEAGQAMPDEFLP